MVMIMGTSICHMVCGTEARNVPGQCGVVEDGILPGLFGSEAGQSAVGDIYAWFVKNCVPEAYEKEARQAGLSIHDLLARKAAKLRPGETGLLAIDWWNGNRSVLVDADLSGLMIGMTLATRPPEMYRALIEATAFGTRTIIDAFEAGGIRVERVVTCGGLPERNRLLMQIYADVTGRALRVAASAQTPALGSAMFGAVVAGSTAGGYASIKEAAAHMAHLRDVVYEPIEANRLVYNVLYREYVRLHDLFGRGGDPAIKTLKRLRVAAKEATAVRG
jgi:L-ribulokinase